MTADIDRDKLRELCERATPGPWGIIEIGPQASNTQVCRDGRQNHLICDCGDFEIAGSGPSDAAFIAAARTALPALLDLTDAQAAKIATQSGSLNHANVCLEGYAATHERLLAVCEPASRRDLPIPERVERLAQMHKEQAAKIAELEAELRAARKERDDAICTAGAFKGIGAAFLEVESERDKLRKQVEAQFVAGMREAAEIVDDAYSTYTQCTEWDYGAQNACAALERAILSAASALEQKEQG